jgi:hypothetical protein
MVDRPKWVEAMIASGQGQWPLADEGRQQFFDICVTREDVMREPKGAG